MKTELIWLNTVNGADKIEEKYAKICMREFDKTLYGVVMGSAYGGSVEAIARLWKDRGYIWGYDVFEDLHPTHLAEDPGHFEATCMEHWYQEDVHGTKGLNCDYQRQMLKELGLNNAFLAKGEVHKESCKGLMWINYAFLDMDILKSMENGYDAVKDKIVKGGYLLLHDVDHIDTLTPWYEKTVLGSKKWEVVEDIPASHIVVLRKL